MSRPLDRDELVRDLLRQPRPAAVDAARAARVRQAVHAAWRNAAAGKRRWQRGVAIAAAAVLVFAIALPLVDRLREPSAPPATGPIVATLFATSEVVFQGAGITTNGGRAAIALPNGVELRLDSDTVITVDAERRVSLTHGAIYLDSSNRQGPPEPVEIVARGAVIRDIGTRYEVRLSDQEVRVRVREGRVEVASAFGTRKANRGGQLRVTPSGILVSTAPISGADWDWIVRAMRPPQLEGRPLTEFLAWAEREGGRTIRFSDAALEQANAATIVYGAIERLTVDEAIDVVLSSCGLSRRNDGDVITVIALDDARGTK